MSFIRAGAKGAVTISARLESQIHDAEWDAHLASLARDTDAWLDAQAELDRLKLGRLKLPAPEAAEALASEM